MRGQLKGPQSPEAIDGEIMSNDEHIIDELYGEGANTPLNADELRRERALSRLLDGSPTPDAETSDAFASLMQRIENGADLPESATPKGRLLKLIGWSAGIAACVALAFVLNFDPSTGTGNASADISANADNSADSKATPNPDDSQSDRLLSESESFDQILEELSALQAGDVGTLSPELEKLVESRDFLTIVEQSSPETIALLNAPWLDALLLNKGKDYWVEAGTAINLLSEDAFTRVTIRRFDDKRSKGRGRRGAKRGQNPDHKGENSRKAPSEADKAAHKAWKKRFNALSHDRKRAFGMLVWRSRGPLNDARKRLESILDGKALSTELQQINDDFLALQASRKETPGLWTAATRALKAAPWAHRKPRRARKGEELKANDQGKEPSDIKASALAKAISRHGARMLAMQACWGFKGQTELKGNDALAYVRSSLTERASAWMKMKRRGNADAKATSFKELSAEEQQAKLHDFAWRSAFPSRGFGRRDRNRAGGDKSDANRVERKRGPRNRAGGSGRRGPGRRRGGPEKPEDSSK